MTADDGIAEEAEPEPSFRMIGDAGGPACAGDVCELPAAAHPLPDGASPD